MYKERFKIIQQKVIHSSFTSKLNPSHLKSKILEEMNTNELSEVENLKQL